MPHTSTTPAPLLQVPRATRYTTVVCISAGAVVAQRVRPALKFLAPCGLEQVVFVDIGHGPPFALEPGQPGTATERYLRIGPDNRPPDWGAAPEHTLALVCSPSNLHAPYAAALQGRAARIAVEKPLALSRQDADRMARRTDLCAIGHQLFKAPMLAFLDSCRHGALDPTRIAQIDFFLLESVGVGARQIDDVIWDLAFHGFECILAPLRAAGVTMRVDVERALTARYSLAGEPHPSVTTAAIIEGVVTIDGRAVQFAMRVGKGVGVNRKEVVFRDARGVPVATVAMNESGWHAHARLLSELLTAEHPDMRLGLDDAASIVGLCCRAVRVACAAADYEFGTVPNFLQWPRAGEAGHPHRRVLLENRDDRAQEEP